MKIVLAALGLLTIGTTVASAQDWRRYDERRRYERVDCRAVLRSIYDLERMIRNGTAGNGVRPALHEARAKYDRYCR